MTFAIRRVDAETVRPMRHQVLRWYQPFDAVRYPGDDDPDTAHFAAYDEQGEIVGIASAYRQPLPGTEDDHTWRLRGMATAEHVRGTGTGARLLAEAVEHATSGGGALMWCNARSTAVWFYERYGWTTVSDEFDDADNGPHFRMTRQLR